MRATGPLLRRRSIWKLTVQIHRNMTDNKGKELLTAIRFEIDDDYGYVVAVCGGIFLV